MVKHISRSNDPQRSLCGRNMVPGFVIADARECKSCTKIYAARTADGYPGTGLPVAPVMTREADDTGKTWLRVARPLDILTPSQRALIGATDGPARFRARHGKRKPSSHRRGW